MTDSVFEKLRAEQLASQTSAQMPRYKCHKEVWALKISEIIRAHERTPDPNTESDGCEGGAMIIPAEPGFGAFFVDAAYLRRHQPKVGGYYVVYDDGYKSFSPAVPFESGYTRVH